MKQVFYFGVIFILAILASFGAGRMFPSLLSASANEILGYIGVVVTLLSLSTSLYFLVLAVTAFGHIRDIEGISKFVAAEKNKLDDEISKARIFIDKNIREFSIFRGAVEQDKSLVMKIIIELTDVASAAMLNLPNSDPKHIDELFRIRSRYAFRTATNDDQRRAQSRTLAAIGDRQDREEIKLYLRTQHDKESRELLQILEDKG